IRWATLRIMPRTDGVSSSSRVLRILFKPRPTSVSFWPGLRPSADAVCVTRTLGIGRCLRRRGRGAYDRIRDLAAAKQLWHLLATAGGDRARAGAFLQRRERRLHHVMRV